MFKRSVFRHYLSCILAFCFTLCSTSALFNQNTVFSADDMTYESQYQCYVNLMEYFNRIQPNGYNEEYEISTYPNDYAGAYFNCSNDNVVTLFLTSLDNSEEYTHYIPTAKIEVVPYSYNYLKSIVDETTIHMQEYDISSIRLNEKNNEIDNTTYGCRVTTLVGSLGVTNV